MLLGIIGAAMFYGDALITPAISVLSAVEGLKLVTPALERLRRPAHGADPRAVCSRCRAAAPRKVAAFFGPIMVVWFVAPGSRRHRPHLATIPASCWRSIRSTAWLPRRAHS